MEFDSKLVEDVMTAKSKIVRVWNVKAAPAVGKYENYLSEMVRLTLTVETKAGEERNMTVLVKTKRCEEGSYDMTEKYGFFRVETMVYSDILRALDTMIDDENDEELKLWPVCYGFAENMIFMEDLIPQGFKLAAKHLGQDLNHARLVLRSLGRFHALMMVLVERGRFDPSKLIPHYSFRNTIFMTNLFINALVGLANTIESSWGPEWKEIPERLRTASEDVGVKLQEFWKSTRGKFDVINHGDCWTNNMLFKYSPGTNVPSEVRFVDYQGTHYNSIGYDLNYYLHCALLPSIRFANLEPLLAVYHESLQRTCSRYGFKGRLPSPDQVLEAYRAVNYYGFLCSVSHLSLFLASVEEGFEYNIEDPHLIPGGATTFFRSQYVNDVMKQELIYYMNKNLF